MIAAAPRRPAARVAATSLGAAVAAALIVVGLEAMRAIASDLAVTGPHLRLTGHGVVGLVAVAWPLLLTVAAGPWIRARNASRGVDLGLIVIEGGALYLVCAREPTLAHPAVALACLGAAWGRARIDRADAASTAIVAGCAAAAVNAVDASVLPGRYPDLHRALAAIAWIGWFSATTSLARATPRVGRAVGIAATAAVAAALVGFAIAPSPPAELRARAPLASAAPSSTSAPRWITSDCPPPLGVEAARATFAAHAALPPLPADLDLARHDVLLVLLETTRYDDTSLAPGGPPTTPRLAALGADAHVFHAAMAPSSTTIPSTAALFTMRLPTQAGLAVDRYTSWRAAIRDDRPRVADAFRAIGHRTFLVGHYGMAPTSLHQGFDEVSITAGSPTPAYDEATAARAIAEIRESPDRRYFGVVFFESPHVGYHAHAGWPQDARGRYRGEIAHADRQLGRVLDALAAAGTLERTIVIVTADHGEEFGEHGRTDHAQSTTRQVLHVPLVVRIPGHPGVAHLTPTSNLYILPWLLQAGPPPLVAASDRALVHSIAPAMSATGGAVIGELLRDGAEHAALIYPRHVASLTQPGSRLALHDRVADPDELAPWRVETWPSPATSPIEPLGWPLADEVLPAWRARVAGYLRHRGCTQDVTYVDRLVTR